MQQIYWKETSAYARSYEFPKSFKNSYFVERRRTATSEIISIGGEIFEKTQKYSAQSTSIKRLEDVRIFRESLKFFQGKKI